MGKNKETVLREFKEYLASAGISDVDVRDVYKGSVKFKVEGNLEEIAKLKEFISNNGISLPTTGSLTPKDTSPKDKTVAIHETENRKNTRRHLANIHATANCRMHGGSVWAFCDDIPLRDWMIGPEGADQALRNCNWYYTHGNGKDH